MRSAVALLVSIVALAASAAGATTSGDLCPGAANPCVLACGSARVAVTNTTLDFGQCDLVLAAGARLRVSPGITVTIVARSLRLASGARIDGTGDARTPGATLHLTAAGTLALDGGASIDVSGSNGGLLYLRAGAAVDVAGALTTTALAAAGRGGSVSVLATGPITVDHTIDTSGGTGDGGDIDLDGTAVTVNASLVLTGSPPGGGGGDFSASASGGAVLIAAPVSTAGSRGTASTGGGNGGDVSLSATGDVRLTAPVTATGGAPDADGGRVDVSGGTVVQQAAVDASTVGSGTGGAISLAADGALTTGTLAATGGSGGDVELSAGTTATVGGPIDAGSTGGDGDGGGISVSGNEVLVTSVLAANGDTRRDSGGSVGITGCSITLTADAELDARGVQGANLLQASGAMVMQGTLSAVPGGTNRIEYRSQVPTVSIRRVNPTAAIVQNPALPPCPGTATTTTSTSTSTTTVRATSTVSTTHTTTTSTSSTRPVSVTTTTALTATTATLPTITTTTIGGPGSTTTTSTAVATSSTRPPTTSTIAASTTTTEPGACVPLDCDDANLCTADACVAGTCDHTPLADIDAVTCRLDGLLAVASATPVGRTTVAVRERLLSKIGATRRVVERARPLGRRRTAFLARADRRLRVFAQFVDKAQVVGRLDVDAATTLATLAEQARAEIARLR